MGLTANDIAALGPDARRQIALAIFKDEQQKRALQKQEKKNKYNAEKSTYNGELFDSTKEASVPERYSTFSVKSSSSSYPRRSDQTANGSSRCVMSRISSTRTAPAARWPRTSRAIKTEPPIRCSW